MIRFQDVVRKKNFSELPLPIEYQDIKAADNLTKEQSYSFWDDLFKDFEKEQDANDIDENKLIAEVFGRFEDEFDFDFEIDNELQVVLDKFNNDKWDMISESERKALIEELSSKIGERLGLEKMPEVRFFDGAENICGAYNPQDNSIEINRNIFSNPKEVVDTVAHEMRHAYQHQHALNPESHLDLLYKCNFENYISPIQLADGKYLFFTDYQDQLVEAEARAYASLFSGKEVLA